MAPAVASMAPSGERKAVAGGRDHTVLTRHLSRMPGHGRERHTAGPSAGPSVCRPVCAAPFQPQAVSMPGDSPVHPGDSR